ncbi:unnamed protein product [Prorocentrum cordatum]|uniref:Uncharacterized protein n=1 Tax=Prorocentrum cordatum TaxID=2364126 RepID=A0ABN9TXI7_9DINO|nr:unnamed protein product [Polarella glacialis]
MLKCGTRHRAPAEFRVPPLRDGDRVRYGPNKKKPGSNAFKRYERYKRAATVGEARSSGAASVDFGHDIAKGHLRVVELDTSPLGAERTLKDPRRSSSCRSCCSS